MAGGAALGLSACVSDPAFMEGLAMALADIEAETAWMAEDARCHDHLSTTGEWITFCPLPEGYVAEPVYAPPHHGRPRGHHRERDRPRKPRR
jgi:hypothetical protein